MNRLRHTLTAAVVCAAVLTAAAASAQTLTRGPLLQNPDALATRMTIAWWTNVVGDSTVEYGLTPALGSSVTVPQAPSCAIGSAGTCHTVTLTGLTAGTRYYYRLLTNGVEVLGVHSFRTFQAPGDPNDVFFTVIGDFGQGSSGQTDVAENQIAADPPLVLTVGDNAYQSGTQSDWDNNVFTPEYRQLLRGAVFMPALGNHDLISVGASSWASSVEIRMHLLPRNAPAGQEERFYSFDSGDAHFVVLDSNPGAVNATQTTWLANDLASTPRKWKFVFLHHTPYSCANGLASIGSDFTVRSTWGPIFEQYGVDIVFTGHDHLWERSKVVDDFQIGGGSGSDGLGTVYLMTGGGGATLDSAANSDSGGPYRQPFLGSKTYCPWLSNQCPNGVGGQYCSFARYSHAEVRIQDNDVLTVEGIDRNGVVFDQLTIVKTQVCGDGTVQDGEDCDLAGANGSAGSCCTSSCTFRSAGSTCRASAGACDLAETCSGASGACPVDAKATGECRAPAGLCDVAESCDGTSDHCPADGFATPGTPCRGAVDTCDVAEACDGTGPLCPSDQLAGAGTPCRGATGDCDVAEVCTGTSASCPADELAAAGTICRGAFDLCDQAEACTGTSPACPADVFLPAGSVCRPAAGSCDVAETCTGASPACPANQLVAGGVPCRAAAGLCDLAESCTGSSPECPADAVAPASTVCRASAGVCDVSETCNGVSPACPVDGFLTSATTCRASTAPCDAAEHCTGSSAACPVDALSPAGAVCRPPTAGCDSAETCSGSSPECPADGLSPAGTVCRAVAGACDVAESCDGVTAQCPADGFAASSVVCRPSLGVCDVAEQCTGTSAQCPENAFVSSSTVCRPAFGACDEPESCTGSSATCPSNAFAPAGTTCRAPAGLCDAPEVCSGASSACPADELQPSGVVCRPAAGDCDVAEACDGLTASCPADSGLPDGDDDGTCDAEDACPAEPDPLQGDADGDGVGDACDPCSNFLPVVVAKANLRLSKLANAPGDDRLKFSGRMTVPESPPIDPLSHGVRVLVARADGSLVLDATLPGGLYDPLTRAGWKVNAANTVYTYRNAGVVVPLVGGLSKVVVKKSARVPGAVQFSVTGKDGSYAVAAGDLPLVGTVVLDPPHAATNQCGEAVFPGPSPGCVYIAKSGAVKCK